MEIISVVENELSGFFNKRIEVKSFTTLHGGCISNALKIETNNGAFFVKWGKADSYKMFMSEAASLKALKNASNGDVQIPEVYKVKCESNSLSFIVFEHFEKDIPIPIFDEKLGRGLAAMHKLKANRYGFETDTFCGSTIQNNNWKQNWIEFYIENRLLFLINLIHRKYRLQIKEHKSLETFVLKLPALIPDNSTPSLIHGDLWSGNFMSTNRGPVLIDAAVSFSEREMEFGIITLFGGFSKRFFDSYNEYWALPEDWKDRTPIYQLYHLLNHYYIFGGSYLSQAIQIAKYYTG